MIFYETILVLLLSLFHVKREETLSVFLLQFVLFFFFFWKKIFSVKFFSSLSSMRFSRRRSSRETISGSGSRSSKPERDLGLSFLYHSSRRITRVSYPNLPSYYSFGLVSMPYSTKTSTRSVYTNFQILLYNFLERPAGVKCFIYHFSV